MLTPSALTHPADVRPTLDAALALAQRGAGNLVPFTRELPADLDTPVSVYLKLAAHGAAFLLESVTGGEQVGRYSFIGVRPSLRLTFHAGHVTHTRYTSPHAPRNGHAATTTRPLAPGEDPLHVLQAELRDVIPVPMPDLPRFAGGLVGYLGYSTVRYFEPKLAARLAPAADTVPEAIFLLADTLVAFDHARGRLLLIANARLDGDALAAYTDALARLDALTAALAAPLPPVARTSKPAPATPASSTSNLSPAAFAALVQRAQEHIAAGDIFQIVLSQRLTRTTSAPPFELYRALRRLNPSPYMFFFDFGPLDNTPYAVVGASPEMLVRLEGRHATLRPIAGTRPRGQHPAEDLALERDLLADPKERAEHVMLVDLGRNDLGRVCRYGTVQVPALFTVERYSHVMHIVSQVEGELRDGLTAFDLLRAAFPAGTVSGAPKVRAIELIHELEPEPRGLYAGAVGYFAYDGAMDTCIAIRTLELHGTQAHVQAGAGIVADSDAAREYDETLNKAKALMTALDLAEKGA